MGNTLNDVLALQRSAPLVKWVTPEMTSLTPVTMTRGEKAYNPWYFTGTWPSTLDIWHFTVAYGRMINDVDDREARNVCVIGTAVRDALFGSPEAMLLAFSFSVGVGILAGLFPGFKAARLSPIQALRYE